MAGAKGVSAGSLPTWVAYQGNHIVHPEHRARWAAVLRWIVYQGGRDGTLTPLPGRMWALSDSQINEKTVLFLTLERRKKANFLRSRLRRSRGTL